MKLLKACIAMTAFAALFVVPSVASAIQITHPTGTTAPVGTKIMATNVAHSATAKHTLLNGSFGKITCSQATLTGELVKNVAGGSHVVGKISTAEFRGQEGNEEGAHCSSPLGNVTVTPNHTTNPIHPAGVSSLPWCVTAGKEDVIEIFGEVEGNCTNGKKRAIFFTLHFGSFSCTYSKEVVSGTYTTHPSDAVGTVSKQLFKRVTSGSIFCPAEGELFLAFTLTTDVKEVSGEPLYIDAN
jgi:hypothetical protein